MSKEEERVLVGAPCTIHRTGLYPMSAACLPIRAREAAAMAGPAVTEGANVRNGAENREEMLSDG